MLRERESRPAGIYALSAGGRDQPLGIPADRPRLSWSVGSDTEIDAAAGFEVTVFDGASAEAGEPLWTSRTERPWVNYGGPALPSRARRRWRVEATTTAGERIAAESSFEIGLRDADDWAAEWITAPELPYRRESWDPAPHLRQEFEVDAGEAPPTVARVYASALGLYRLWLNGVELTEDALLRPGWTDYRIRVYHQTFDVAAALRPGTNVLTAVLAGGWYSGRIGLQREPKFYGDRPALLAQLELESADGTLRTVATDADWRAGYGSIQATDLLRGEYQDLRQEPEGWHEPGFDASAWDAAVLADAPAGAVEPQPHDSIAGYEVRPGELVAEHARGPAIYDFGQNVVGWTRIHDDDQADQRADRPPRRDPHAGEGRLPRQPARRLPGGPLRVAGRRAAHGRAALRLPRLPLRRGLGRPQRRPLRDPQSPRGHQGRGGRADRPPPPGRQLRVLQRGAHPPRPQRRVDRPRQLPRGDHRLPAARRAARLARRRGRDRADRRLHLRRRRLRREVRPGRRRRAG